MANTVNESAIKKLKVLFTVVDRPKAEFYLDVLEGYEVNMQTVIYGKGTAPKEIYEYLNLGDLDCSVAIIRTSKGSPSGANVFSIIPFLKALKLSKIVF